MDIASGTYYNKLELLYKRCLEFLDKYETKPLQSMSFNEIWLNSDMMIYHLNNVRKAYYGHKGDDEQTTGKYVGAGEFQGYQ